MLIDLINRRNHIRVLNALREGDARRFNALKADTGLESAQLSRVLEHLTARLLVVAQTIPTEGEAVYMQYRLSKKGMRVMELWDRFHAIVHDLPGAEAKSTDQEMEELAGIA